jgi:dTDP-4-amino-4,6-dideoxygalactose transaminase
LVATVPPRWRILLSGPDVAAAERAALLHAFDGGWVAPVGPQLDRFEADLAAVTGRSHAVALSSGTAALQLGLLALGVGAHRSDGHGSDDEVWVATLTFAATANAVVHAGAHPVFLDVDARTWTLDVDLVAAELEARQRSGQHLPAAIIPVDLYGRCAAYDRLLPIAAEYGVPVLADAAEALGAQHLGEPAGAHGAAAALSFNGNKIITTSGGGALVTDDARIAARVRHLATQAREPVRHYEHHDIGFNHRLSNLLAALGSAQLAGLPTKVARRRAIHDRYVAGLADLDGLAIADPTGPGEVSQGTLPNRWLTCVTVDPAVAPTTRDGVIDVLAAAGIEARPVWKPMHLQPVHAARLSISGAVAQRAFEHGLALPSGSALTDGDIDEVVGRIRECWAR